MVEWEFANKKSILELHVSDYASIFDALYEYPKNLDEAEANQVHVDFQYDKNAILIYGDSVGMDPTELDEIRKGIGMSSKDEKHHGIGMLAFIRFAKKMLIFSKKNGVISVLSCMPSSDRLMSDIGSPRVINQNEVCYAAYYHKLERWDNGTITILEGVGEYKSSHYDFTFDMKKEFDPRKFEKWYKEKIRFRLISKNYFVKFGDEKPHKVEAKLGHGKKVDFKIPSAEYPAEDIPGQMKDSFMQDGFMYKLETEFMFHISPSNDGEIKIGENWQDPINIKDLTVGNRIQRSSIYYNSEYLKYLTGYINFKIKPVNGGPQFNVYSGSRSKILVDGPWGDCLINMLIHADVDILRPMIEDKEDKSTTKKDVMRSKSVTLDMESFFRENREFFDEIMETKNRDSVNSKNYKTCPKCGIEAIPVRCAYAEIKKEIEHIYAPDNMPVYICGSCGKRWPRALHIQQTHGGTGGNTGGGTGNNGGNHKPMYTRPDQEDLRPRRKERGYGYSYIVCGFDKNDIRDVDIQDTIIKINRNHPSYQILESAKNGSVGLGLYERQLSLSAILSRELQNQPKDQFEKCLKESNKRILIWYFTGRKMMSSEELEDVRHKDEVVVGVQDLGARWGARIKKES